MFESKILEFVKRHLDRYVLNLNEDVLQVGLCGKITIEIASWTALLSEPVKCSIEDVLVLAGPVTDRAYDEELDSKLRNIAKQKTLEAVERVTSPGEDVSSSQNSAFWQRLSASVLNNIQVSIQRVHVRFEDDVTCPEYAIACGIMLQEASLETTDEQWRPDWIGCNVPVVYKLLHLRNLSLYWDTFLPEQSLVRNKLHSSAWQLLLQNSISNHRIMDEDFDFLVRPISISVRLKMSREDVDQQTPLLDVDIAMEEFEVLISRQQFLSVLTQYESIRFVKIGERYRKYSEGMQLKGNPRNQWKYAMKATLEEFIRPFSWARISQHRQKYRCYKQLYKEFLKTKDNDDKRSKEIAELETQLDVANILIARENAKLELSQELPNRISRKKAPAGWFGWIWRSSSDGESDEELVVADESSGSTAATNLPDWLQSMQTEERDVLCQSIGYTGSAPFTHSREFVARQFRFRLSSFSVSLINIGREVLKVSLDKLDACYQDNPKSDSFRLAVKTDSFKVEGMSVENELVQVITSDIGVYAPQSAVRELFSINVERRPLHTDADYSLNLNVQPVEIVYDERAVTEMVAFFQTPQVTVDAMRALAQSRLEKIAQMSRTGLQYAIEQHKTLNLVVNMRSPYVVIPEYGTLHRGGNVVIVDLGKLKIESALQPKNISLENCTRSEMESLLYDKYVATLSDLKMLLADSGDDWHTALTQSDSNLHIVPSISVQFSLYNTIKADYKQLPRHKLESRLTALRVCISDDKLRMLVDVCRHIPMPRSNSMIGLDDSIDGHIELSTSAMDKSKLQLDPPLHKLVRIKRSVRLNSTVRQRKRNEKATKTSGDQSSSLYSGSHQNYPVSDQSDDETDGLTKFVDPFLTDDHPSSELNPVLLLGRLVVGGLSIELSQLKDNVAEVPYLMLRLDRACVDVTLAEHCVSVVAQLASIQLVDKQNLGSTGEYLEILGFHTDTDTMTVRYRKLSPQYCDVDPTFHFDVHEEARIELSGLMVIFDREAMLSLNSYIQNLLQSIQSNQMQSSLRKSHSTICSGSGPAAEPYRPEMPGFIDRLEKQDDCSELTAMETKFRIVGVLNDLHVQLCDHDNDLAHVVVRGLKGQMSVHRDHSVFRVQLCDLCLDDRSVNTRYSRIICLDDEMNALDFKYVRRHNDVDQKRMQSGTVTDDWRATHPCDGSVTLRVGRLQAVFVYKFIYEIQLFLQPFVEPDTFRSCTNAAQMAIHNKINDLHNHGSWIKLHVDIHAPVVLVPRHSESSDVIQIVLGNLTVTNSLEQTSCINKGYSQMWDQLTFRLNNLCVIRGTSTANGTVEPIRTIMDPLGFSVDIKRALPPHFSELHCDINGKLHNVTLKLTEVDLTVLLMTVGDNLMEVPSKSEILDISAPNQRRTRLTFPAVHDSVLEMVTPVVEIEQPMLSALDVVDGLLKQTRYVVSIDGVTVSLLNESCTRDAAVAEQNSAVDGLATLSLDTITANGVLSGNSVVDFSIGLGKLTLDDARPNTRLMAVKKMISFRADSSSTTALNPCVVFHYVESKDKSQRVELNLDGLRVNVCATFVLALSDFFSKPFCQSVELFIDGRTIRDGTTDDSRCDVDLTDSNGTTVLTNHVSSSATCTVSARMKRCEVVLFAEPSQRNSRVLLVKADASYDSLSLQGIENSELKVQQLQIISCIYGSSAQTASTELYPCNVEVVRQRAGGDGGTNVNVRISDVALQISAATVNIALDVADAVRKSLSQYTLKHDYNANLSSVNHSQLVPVAATDLWAIQNISRETWSLSGKAAGDAEDTTKCVVHLRCNEPPLETFKLEAKKIVVVYELRSSDYYVPVLSMATALQAQVYDWSKQMRAVFEFQLEMNSYNDRLCVWEPVIEPVSLDGERHHRPWAATVKLVRAASHPIACTSIDLNLDHVGDEVDGRAQQAWSRRQARSEADSSETETDSDTEMTVIKPKHGRPGSHSSYDTVSQHSSIQGESDSEPEVLTTLSSNLRSILSSESADENDGGVGENEEDDDAFDSTVEKPVFLTSIGPIAATECAEDEVDFAEQTAAEDTNNQCNYVVFCAPDQLKVNFTTCNIRILKEVCQALIERDNSSFQSVNDVSSFEVFNQLGIQTKMTVSSDQKVFESDAHNVSMESPCSKARCTRLDLDSVDAADAIDEIDGLANIPDSLTAQTPLVLDTLKVTPENQENPVDAAADLQPGRQQMNIKLEGFEPLTCISYKQKACRLLQLSPTKNETDYCIVCDVDVNHGRRVVTLRSPLQVFNDLTVPMRIFCLADELQKCGIEVIGSGEDKQTTQNVQIACVEPQQHYSVPLYIAYHCRLYMSPANSLYEMTSTAIWWPDFYSIKDRTKTLLCLPQSPNSNSFYFKAIYDENTTGLKTTTTSVRRLCPHFKIRLCPPIVLHNLLPYNVSYSIESSPLVQLSCGMNMPLYSATLNIQPKIQLVITGYMGVDWTGSLDLTPDLEEFKAINMESEGVGDGQNKHLSLSIWVCQRVSMDLYLYSPYWILNKTGLPIQIRGSRSDAVYAYCDETDEPLLFRFKKHRRKKAKVRVYNSKWTRSFSLDSIGSSGVVVCSDKERGRRYQFILHIAVSHLKLTKIVTIMPYFMIVNCTPDLLHYMEHNEQTDLWYDLAPQQCCAFWPATESMKMCIKYHDSKVASLHFPFNIPHRTVLRMDHGTALCIDAGMMEGSMLIRIVPYTVGDIPVRVDNLCEDVFLKLHQKNQSQVTLLSPNKSVLYTWDDPASERTLMWNVYNCSKPSYPAFISKDGSGQVQISIKTIRQNHLRPPGHRCGSKKRKSSRSNHLPQDSSSDDDSDVDTTAAQPTSPGLTKNTRTDKVVIYWVSYLDRSQRVFLLTQDERVAKAAIGFSASERCHTVLFASFAGFGLSLVNDRSEELAYATVSGSTAVWEVESKANGRWKKLPMELSAWLEERWKAGADVAILPDVLEATLDKNAPVMTKPESGDLRRACSPAVWLQLMRSEHNTYLHFKIHCIQIDNQLTDAYFPVVFHPTPQPAYAVKKNGVKPFFELLLMAQNIPEHSVVTYKYVKLLVQAFGVNVDKGFVTSLYDMYCCCSSQAQSGEDILLSKDITISGRKLKDRVALYDYKSQRCIFEYIHLSPLKMKLSLSLDGKAHLSTENNRMTELFNSDVVDFFLNSMGAKLADVNGVEIRLGFFERQGMITSYRQLFDDVTNSYRLQALQQAYVVLLGLDVLGNPYSLIRDVTQGFGDFYEPFISSVQQPDKFAARLFQGVHSLLGHTIGGVSRSASAITGSLGKALSFLSFDSDFKQQRGQLMLHQPAGLPESLSLAGRSFANGVVLGLSGVVTHPIKGAQEKGVEGFFKGLGKALIGLIMKPTSGAVDMVSIVFDGIRRLAELGEDVVIPFRQPRYIHPTLGLKPYSAIQAMGAKMLRSVDHGAFSSTDVYWAHAVLGRDKRADVLLITDRQVMLLEKSRVWAEWSVRWTVLLSCLLVEPFINDRKLIFRISKEDLAVAAGWWNGTEQCVECDDDAVLVWLRDRLVESLHKVKSYA